MKNISNKQKNYSMGRLNKMKIRERLLERTRMKTKKDKKDKI